ncbi:MAG: hypothetical protein WC825_02300 [Gallionellaceae bacterium]|jgi:hypothetical protein
MCNCHPETCCCDHEKNEHLASLERQLAETKDSEKCWIANAKALQVGYNELDAKHRNVAQQRDKLLNILHGALVEDLLPNHSQEWVDKARAIIAEIEANP